MLALSKNNQPSTSYNVRSMAADGSDSSWVSVDMTLTLANWVRLTRNTPNSATPRSTSMSSTRSDAEVGAASRIVTVPAVPRSKGNCSCIWRDARCCGASSQPNFGPCAARAAGPSARHRIRRASRGRGADLPGRGIGVPFFHDLPEQFQCPARVAPGFIGLRRQQRSKIKHWPRGFHRHRKIQQLKGTRTVFGIFRIATAGS